MSFNREIPEWQKRLIPEWQIPDRIEKLGYPRPDSAALHALAEQDCYLFWRSREGGFYCSSGQEGKIALALGLQKKEPAQPKPSGPPIRLPTVAAALVQLGFSRTSYTQLYVLATSGFPAFWQNRTRRWLCRKGDLPNIALALGLSRVAS